MALVFQCKTPDGVVRLDDIDANVFERIAKEHGLDGWFQFYMGPASNVAAARALYEHCCEATKSTPREDWTPRAILDVFSPAEDDLPTLWEDGHP